MNAPLTFVGRAGNTDEVSQRILAVAQGGTSVFDPVLCELAYRWFCPPDGLVLDPFAGGSVRGIVAGALGRRYLGVDLSEAQLAANRAQGAAILGEDAGRVEWRCGDARALRKVAGRVAADFVFSCPPYADLERYSDDPRDLSTMEYPDFRAALGEVIAHCVALLRADRFAAMVIGDVRDKAGFYRGLPGHLIAAFVEAGAPLYNEAVLVPMVGSLAMRVGPQFEVARKLGHAHQYMLVFCKGDPRKATEACGPCDFADPEPESEVAPA